MPGYVPDVLADSIEVYIGSCAIGRARAGNHTVDLIEFTKLPGQPAAVGLTAADVGAPIAIVGGGAVDPLMPAPWFVQGAMFHTTIATVVDAGTCTLTDAPTTSIYNTGFCTVIVYRRVLIQLDSFDFSSSIAPGVRDTLKFTVLGVDPGGAGNAYIERFTTICNGQPIYCRSTDAAVGDIFGGSIDSLVVSNYPGVPDVYSYAATCASWASIAGRRAVPPPNAGVYTDLPGDEVFKRVLFTMCSDEGVSCDAEVAPSITLAAPAGAVVQQLLDQVVALISTSTIGWYWTVDPWRKFILAKQSSTPAPWDVTDGYELFAGQSPNQVSIQTTHNQLANFVYAIGTNVLLNTLVATVVGDGSARTFNLPQPVGGAPTITRDGSPQTVGILGIDVGKDWYWASGSTTLTQDSGGTVLSTSDTLVVTYLMLAPAIAQAPNVASLQTLQGIEGTAATYNHVFQVTAPTLPADLLAMASGYETQYGEPAQTVSASTLRPGLKTGQLQNISFSRAGISGSFLIATVHITSTNNVLVWTYTAFGGANIGAYLTGLVQFINRGGAQLVLAAPSTPITATGGPPKQQVLAYDGLASQSGIPHALPEPVAVGDVIIVAAIGGPSAEFSGPTFSVADSLGNIYTEVAYQRGSAFFYPSGASIWRAKVTVAGICTITVTVTTEAFPYTSWVALVGPAGTDVLDVAGESTYPNPSITTTANGDFIVTVAAPDSLNPPTASGVESMVAHGLQTVLLGGVAVAAGTQVAAGAFTSTLDVGLTVAGSGLVCTAAFKVVAPGPSPQTVPVVVNPQGTVTHNEGALTSGEPIIGHGGGDVTVGSRTGVTDQFVTAAGSPVTGAPLVYEATGDAIAGAPGALVPPGGTGGQVLAKVDGTDYNTAWTAAGGGGPYVHAIYVDGVWMSDDYDVTVNETPITVNGA